MIETEKPGEPQLPICLECKNLVWCGFYAHCVCIFVPQGLLDEARELAEARMESAIKAVGPEYVCDVDNGKIFRKPK